MNDQNTNAPVESGAQPSSISTRIYRYRNLLLTRWWVLIICMGLAVAVASAYLRNAKPLFSSVGQMIVSVKLNLQAGSLYSEDLANFLGTQMTLMQGGEVVQRAIDHVASQNPNLPTPALQPSLRVSIIPKTTIFTLTATGDNPDYTKAFLQAAMEEYINMKKQMVLRTSDTTSAGLTEQMMRLEPEMQKDDAELQAFMNTNDAALLAESAGMQNYVVLLFQKLADSEAELDLLKSLSLDQSILLEQKQASIISPVAEMDPRNPALGGNVLVSSGLANSAAGGGATIGVQYLSTKQQVLLLKADRDRYAASLKPKHPQMVLLDQQINKLSRELEIYRQQSTEQLEARESALKLEIASLQVQTKQQSRLNLELSRKASQFQRLQAKSARVQALYDQLLAMLQTLDVNKEISPESVVIYQPASDAYENKNTTQKTLVFAAFAGLALGLVVLFVLDRLDDRINSLTEFQQFFDEEVLGQIPRERRPKHGTVVPPLQIDDERHPFVESYRNLRSSLLYMSQEEPRPRAILVTSSVPGDGKSVTAANFAITLSLGGSRVLLVDADLRKGSLHSRLNVPNENGFSEVFLNEADWRTNVQATTYPSLFMIPRGQTTQRSGEFFIGPIMTKFLADAKKEYDYVVIDSAPVMAADDVTSLAPRMDGVIFVIRAEHVSARVARSALNMLYQRKANVLGVVLNSVSASSGEYYYYYNYSDYKA